MGAQVDPLLKCGPLREWCESADDWIYQASTLDVSKVDPEVRTSIILNTIRLLADPNIDFGDQVMIAIEAQRRMSRALGPEAPKF